MSTNKKLVIGMFGFGVVGEGLYRVLAQTPSLEAEIKKVVIKHPDKNRNAPRELFTTDKDELLNDPEINVIVEVIDDAKAAYEIISTALNNGKGAISASKKMIAENLTELLALQQKTKLPFLYESAVCASIPVIRNLEEYYDNDLLHAFQAIVNGSTNFILSKMFNDHLDFSEALELAQNLGFAESNPSLDVEGFDALNKLILLLVHAYGIVATPNDVLFTGIQNIGLKDAQIAKERNNSIKLVAQARKLPNGTIATVVLPQFVANEEPLSFVKNEFNGVIIESGFAEKQFFYGKGAGSLPTGSAVLSDLSALRYNYKYEYKKLNYHESTPQLACDYYLRVYLRFEEESLLPKDQFKWIEEWYLGPENKYLVGGISHKNLKDQNWWKEKGYSLILIENGIFTEDEIPTVNIL